MIFSLFVSSSGLVGPVAALMAHFSRPFQHFASAGNTRYD
jgi:hypothetical protein